MKKPIVVIVGPTAVGKTQISIEVAKKINGEIISADSMQIYKYMDIGTAKPTKEEMQNITHYLIDEIYPDQDFNVALFQQRAFHYIDKILSKGKIPIVVGGTGLYVNSLVHPLDFTESITNWEYRKELNKIAEKNGNVFLHDMLKKVDPKSASQIHPNNRKRIIRALEVYHETGRTMSYYKDQNRNKSIPFQLVYFGLNMERDLLYDRINKRVDIMIESGLIQEVKDLLSKGYHSGLVSMQGLGYKEIIKYLQGQYTYQEAVYILKRDTRRFAKRQITWFKRDDRIMWFKLDEYESKEDVVTDMAHIIKKEIPLKNDF